MITMPAQIQSTTFHDLPALELRLPNGGRALVSQHGAQVLSWTPPGGQEWLYLSDQARFAPGEAIRGGIPVCFPQFSGLGPLPKHGLVRTATWEVCEQRAGDDYALVRLERRDDEASRALWPHPFRAEMIIGIEGMRLDLELEIENTGDTPLTFTAALHTYLRVNEVEEIIIEGLHGVEYRDAAHGDVIRKDSGTRVTVDSEIDRVYHDVSKPLLLRDDRRALAIHKEAFPDVVVWNPWEEKCAGLADMPAKGFRHMLCVEAAAARQPVTLAAGDTWWGRQTLCEVTGGRS